VSAQLLFFVGKGGVGKTTCASLLALKLARSGRGVLLNSIDPAHNLHDVFQMPLSARPRRIVPGLQAMETDLESWVKRYLKQTEEDLRSVYRYQETFNLHRYFRTLRYSPGLEEYAVLLALEDTVRRYDGRQFILFDTPPTALTLRFLALPDNALLWLRELSAFRRLILEKKEIIVRVKQGRKGVLKDVDPILEKLEGLTGRYQQVSDLLKDPARTRIFLVLNPDRLSLSESKVIWNSLRGLGIRIAYLILNKLKGEGGPDAAVAREFPGARLLSIPRKLCDDITGLELLESLQAPLDVSQL
jgi:arsenite-transporting ATPase